MGFVTPALLAGSVLVAVPLLLHLIMRRQPRHHTFPALRFVQQRHESNQRRMKFRHLLLLALRCILIGGLAFALARPTFQGGDLHGKQGAPLALALVLDNSLRMQYVYQQQALLEKARDMAVHLIDQLPTEASVVVLDRGRMVSRHLSEPSIARTRLKRLTYSSHPRPMENAVRTAIELVDACEECRQEVVVFTDMTRASLTETTIEQIAEAMEGAPAVRLYLVDVGVDKPHNLALGNLHLNSEVLTPGESLHMEIDLRASTASATGDEVAIDLGQGEALGLASSEGVTTSQRSQNDRSQNDRSPMDDSQLLVELYLKDEQGQPVKRGQQWYSPAGPSQQDHKIIFELADLALGTHQGSIHLAVADSLMIDNTRYFTVVVHSPARVLLAGNSELDTLFVREALSPSISGLSTQDATSESRSSELERVETSPSSAAPSRADLKGVRFLCDSVRFDDLDQTSLDLYDAVGLLDPPALSEIVWQNLADFASVGRGVGIFLGHRASRQAFNRESAAASLLLPGKLRRRSREITYFSPQRFDHPALKELADYAADIPWPIYPVLQFWEFSDELAADTRVIARFHNNQPALLARLASSGRVLTMTTPLSDPREPMGREPWNLLPTGPEPWPFVLLSGNLFGFLTQESNQRTMFQAGETISVPLAPRQQVSSFILQQPDGHSLRQTLPPGQNAIRISTAETLGNYRLAAGGKLHLLDHGFSINTSAKSSLLTRVEPAQLTTALTSERVHFSRTITDVQQEIDMGRSGQDLFPWAIFLVALVWGTEHLLANRFYREPS